MAGLTLPVSFEVGNAERVALADNSFDMCRTERVLRYVHRPEAALGEMARLACPGGSVMAFDFDSDQTIVDVPDPALASRIAVLLDGLSSPSLDWPAALRAIQGGWST